MPNRDGTGPYNKSYGRGRGQRGTGLRGYGRGVYCYRNTPENLKEEKKILEGRIKFIDSQLVNDK